MLVFWIGVGGCLQSAPPEGYYNAADGLSGGQLKEELRKIITRDHRSGAAQHTIVPYDLLFPPLREIWRDPAIPANVLPVYSSPSVSAFSSTWNREHLWPRSRGNSEQAGPDDSDLFHVVPANSQVNSLRSNRYFDNSDPIDPSYTIPAIAELAPQASYDSNSWQPAPGERGDIARAMFYMDVRYNGSEPNTTDLELVSFPPSGPQMGNLNTLLLWHAEDPPDDAERARNDLIYSNYQGNRNPFIDHPEYVEAIWGTGLPGDPINLPLARVEAIGSTASENPSSPGRITISMNQFAGVGGVRVRFQMSGAAGFDDYILTGDGVSYDPASGTGEVLIQQGFSKALVILTPVLDDLVEPPEAAEFWIVEGDGYRFTPDASSRTMVIIRDTPWLPAYWNFNEVSPTAQTIPSNVGEGVLSFANWTGTIASFSGTQGNALALVGSAGNNSSVDFQFSMLGYRDLSLTFSTRGTSSGFTTGTWSFSTDGTNFTVVPGNTATTSTSFLSRNVSFSGYSSLTNAPSVTVRYTLSGATGSSGNNRIDDLQFSATKLATGNEPREVSVAVSPVTALEQPLTPSFFRFTLNGLAPSDGLSVAFAVSGLATAGADYEIQGAQTWDPVTRTGTVFFEENADTTFITLQPVRDNNPEPPETVSLSLPDSIDERYLVGQSRTATALIRDLKHNDNFEDAYVLSGLAASTSGDNNGATRESGEPRHYGNTGSTSVWWKWTATTNTTVSLSTVGSSFDTILAVYSGSSVNALTLLASDDDSGGGLTSRLVFAATAGTTYSIAVDGYGNAQSGLISLALEPLNSPLINSFSPDQGVPGASVTITGYNFLEATSVLFGGDSASFSVISDTQIVATVPAGARSGVLTISSATGTGQSANWFSVARSPSLPEIVMSRQALPIQEQATGNFTVSASSIPGPLRIAAPAGFEVSVDGVNFAQTLDVVAPPRIDSASNYENGWSSGSNEGRGFSPWNFTKSSGDGVCDVVLASPEDSEITNFGTQAFCLYASPAGSGAWASVSRGFEAPLAVGESFSLRWGLNWDPNTSTGYNYFSLYSGSAYVLNVWQGSFPGPVNISWPGGGAVNTGIAYGNQPMTWTFTLVNSSTLRVTATDRNGGSQPVFTRDIPVAGAPDAFNYYAYQLDPDVRRRGYFNDLRIDSAVVGGGHLPATLVHVRKSSDSAQAGSITFASQGQELATLSVSTQSGNAFEGWAQDYGLDPQGDGALGADPDGDGHSNLHEYLFGGDPKQGQGPLFGHAIQGGNFTLTFLGREVGGSYAVQTKASLTSGEWILEQIPATEVSDQSGVPDGYKRFQFSLPVPSGSKFYRLRGAGE